MKKAFTLIELLVVVLIIGILAAIALPQYEKAVHKSRFAEALVRIKSLRDAVELYILENGYPTSNVDLIEMYSDLQNGLTANPDEDFLYAAQYTAYRAYCGSSACYVRAYYNDQRPPQGDLVAYDLVDAGMDLSKSTGQWTQRCLYNAWSKPSLGKVLCDITGYPSSAEEP